MLTAQSTSAAQKFKLGRSTNGDITVLSFQGVVDEGFEGKKVAESIRTKKVVLDLRGVRRFASWGMAEWSDFLRLCAARDVYVVECSTHALGQFSLVTGLLGHAKLVSLYVPFRCGHCSEESELVMVLPIDRAAILGLADREQACSTCGGVARVDKYVAEVCQALAERPAFDIDDEVVAYLRRELKYNVSPDLARFRAHRRAQKGYTYLRLSGDLAGLPSDALAKASEGTVVVDLERIRALDPTGVSQWRNYLQAVPAQTSLQLHACPPGFLEQAVTPEDFSRLKVRTFQLPYGCVSCNATTVALIDVAQHLEHLVEGVIPPARCDQCKSQLEAAVPPMLAAIVRKLPVREHDVALDKFLEKSRSEPNDKLEDALVARPVRPTKPASGSRMLYAAIGALLLVVGGLGVLGWTLWTDRERTHQVASADPGIVPPKPTPTFQRPSWILSDLPSSAFCHDLVNRLMCVGVSSYRASRNEAAIEANEAALDELVNTVALRIDDPFFQDSVLSAYTAKRAQALAALQAADVDRRSDTYAAANEVVRTARKRVAEIFKTSGGPAVPTQRTDWYWEEYNVESGVGTELLVFVRYDVTLDIVKALVERYSTHVDVLGGSAITAFPGLAWQHESFTGGVMFAKLSKQLEDAGIQRQHIVTGVNDRLVVDAGALDKQVRELTGPVTLMVEDGGVAPKLIEIRR